MTQERLSSRLLRRVPPESLLLCAMAATIAALLVYLGPPGTDFAAHRYQAALFASHGFSLWNNLWYSGRYSFVTYSTLYYPLAALVGIRALAVLCVAVAVPAFAGVVRHRWAGAATWSVRSAALVLPGFVLTAAFPFLLGATLSLVALLALQRSRPGAFAVLCFLVAAASPLAFVLLGLIVLGFGIGDRWSARKLAMTLATQAVVLGILLVAAVLFPSGARYPFPTEAFVPAMAFSALLAALTWRVEAARPLRVLALLNAGACVLAFVVSTEIGEGITRLRFAALPIVLLALALRRWRPRGVAVAAVALCGYWNVAPLAASFVNGMNDATQHAAYWDPATKFLRSHLTPDYRVESVDTQRHWAAAYLPAAGIPLARGWFRQDDFPQNAVLYEPLSARAYLHWLRGLGVRFVVLTDGIPDYSARRETALLQAGHSGLRSVLRTAHLRIFAVPHPAPIVTGPAPARVRSFGRDRVSMTLRRAGRYRVAVRYSPYWVASMGCVTDGADGMLSLRVPRGGAVGLRFDVGASALLRVLAGGRSSCA